MTSPTLQSAVDDWLAVIKRAKAPTTYATYRSSASIFLHAIGRIMPPQSPVSDLTDFYFGEFLKSLKYGSPKTEKQHSTIIALFYEYLSAKRLVTEPNLMDSIRYMRRNETRKIPHRLRKIDFPAVHEIAKKTAGIEAGKDVCLSRAKAFVLLLIGSGLRASEAISLQTDDLDFKKMRGVVIGKGDKEARFIIAPDTVTALKEYISLRRERSNWLFISHSKRDGGIARPIGYNTARRDVMIICNLLLEHAPEFKITPHQFRHYFATQIWRETGDIVQAQTALRHENIATTQGYVHTNEADLLKLEKSMTKARKHSANHQDE